MTTTKQLTETQNKAFNAAMNSGLLTFLVKAYSLPIKIQAELIVEYADLDKRNETTLLMLLGFYAITYEGLTHEDLAARADELSENGLFERFLAKALILTFYNSNI